MLKKQIIAIIFFIALQIIISFRVEHAYQEINIVIFYFTLLVISVATLPYIKSKLNYSHWIQVVLFGLPMILPMLNNNVCIIGEVKIKHLYVFFFYAIILIFALLLLHFKEYKEYLNGISAKIKLSKTDAFLNLLELIYFIFCEEYFFRAFIIGKLLGGVGYYEVLLISGFLFVLIHFLNKWSAYMFNLKNYISQFLLAILGCMLYIETKLLIFVILLHLLYNFSEVILIIRRSMVKDEKSDGFFDDYN